MYNIKKLRDWAKYYHKYGISVWASVEEPRLIRWDDIFRQSIAEMNSFNWEKSVWIKGIAGRAGITILEVKLKGKDTAYIFKVVTRLLSLLELYNYPWVIFDKNGIWIILDCNIWDGNRTEFYGLITILWRGLYVLPYSCHASASEATFYFNGLPDARIASVKKNVLRGAIGKLVEEFGLFFDKEM